MIREAAEELDRELRPFPWFVSVGIVDGTVDDPLFRELIVYTNRKPNKIKYPFATAICEIPIRVEYMGNPKPC